MNVHEHALELAAGALDFPLAAAERHALDGHLATCLRCRSDADGLGDDARRLASRPLRRLAPHRAEAIRTTLERPQGAMSPAMIFVAAALLLVLAFAAAAVGSQIVRRLDEQRLAFLPAPSGLVTPAPLPSASPATPGTASWQLASLGELSGLGFQPTSVARSDTGWVAVGSGICGDATRQTYDCMLQVAVSQDGVRWEAVAGDTPLVLGYSPPSSGPEKGMVDVAAGPDGYVAVGFGSGDLGPGNAGRGVAGTAWWSPDGRTWTAQRLDEGARPTAVFRAADRWLIGGVIHRDAGPIGAIWTSTDGRSWTLIDDPATFDVGGYVDTMEDPASGSVGPFAASGGTVVAGGQVCAVRGRPCAAAAWRSQDGLTWKRANALPAGEWTTGLAAAGSGFVTSVAVCGDGSVPCSTALLRSTDGRTWEQVPGTLPESVAMASSDRTVALVTGEYRNVTVLASADGTTWTTLDKMVVPDQVNWGAPTLVARGDGGIQVMIRSDPVDPLETDADATVTGWVILPAD
jgi:hypothetical protein